MSWANDMLARVFGVRVVRPKKLRPVESDPNTILIPIDFPVRPRRRNSRSTMGGKKIAKYLESHHDQYHRFLHQAATFREDFAAIPVRSSEATSEPTWVNGWIPGLDSASIYTLIRTMKPRTYFEVGSGNSTKFARRAIVDGGLATRIVSVDPSPRAEIDRLCDEVIRKPFEDLSEDDWLGFLSPGDVVFIDNSHRSFQSSDVTVFFTEMLPTLPPGTVWGCHDIFLPDDYPEGWAGRYYSEQYLLAAYLLGGSQQDEVVFPAAFVSGSQDFRAAVDLIFSSLGESGVEAYGGAFWMRRKPSS